MIRAFLLLLLFSLLATSVFSQKILAFDKSGKVKRVRYFEGEYISVKTIGREKVKGIISLIQDSSFAVEGRLITLDSVAKVYNTQTGMGFQLVSNIFIFPAVGYFPLLAINGLINSDSPLIRQNQLYYGSAFIGVALITNFLANRPFRITDKRPLKVFDISP